jgi:hypothetical protein
MARPGSTPKVKAVPSARFLVALVAMLAGGAGTAGCDGSDDAGGGGGGLVGEVETLVFDSDDGATAAERQHFLTLGDAARTRYRLIFDAEPEPFSTRHLRVFGTAVGDRYHVSGYESLPEREAGGVGSVTSALVGAASRTRRAAFVLVDVGGGVSLTADSAQTNVFGGRNFASVYEQLSFGTLKFEGDVVGPLSFPMTTCDYNGLQRTLKPMITGTYDHYMWYIGSKVSACSWSGIGAEGNATTPRADSWYNASSSCVVLVQEVGHNLGMMHSSTLACSGQSFVNDPSTCTSSEYGNRYTPMGSACGHLNAHDKWYERFFGGCNAVKVTASATINLMPIEAACNGIQAVQIPMLVTTRTVRPTQGNSNIPLKNYYLEYRGPWGYDSSTARNPTVLVHAGDDIHAANRTSTWSWLLDMNPMTTNAFDGMTVGQTFNDPAGSISFTLMSADTTKAVVQITIEGGTGEPTCMDGTTVAAPGPADCGPGSGVIGAGGAGGGTTTPGTGGRAATGSGGRAGTGGASGTGGATSAGTGGRTGSGGSGPLPGTGGGTPGTGGRTGPVGTGGSGPDDVSGTGGAGPTGPGAVTPGGVTGSCACTTDGGTSPVAWPGLAGLLFAVILSCRRHRRPRTAPIRPRS